MIRGNSVKVKGIFVSWEGIPIDATDPVLKIYEGGKLSQTINLTESNHIATGTYVYDYVVPEGYSPVIFEFSGMVEGSLETGKLQEERTFD